MFFRIDGLHFWLTRYCHYSKTSYRVLTCNFQENVWTFKERQILVFFIILPSWQQPYNLGYSHTFLGVVGWGYCFGPFSRWDWSICIHWDTILHLFSLSWLRFLDRFLWKICCCSLRWVIEEILYVLIVVIWVRSRDLSWVRWNCRRTFFGWCWWEVNIVFVFCCRVVQSWRGGSWRVIFFRKLIYLKRLGYCGGTLDCIDEIFDLVELFEVYFSDFAEGVCDCLDVDLEVILAWHL